MSFSNLRSFLEVIILQTQIYKYFIPLLGDEELIRNLIYDANATRHVFRHLQDGFIAPPELNFKLVDI